jgi:acid stress-induced BolA-like protein IbaG/YrbA
MNSMNSSRVQPDDEEDNSSRLESEDGDLSSRLQSEDEDSSRLQSDDGDYSQVESNYENTQSNTKISPLHKDILNSLLTSSYLSPIHVAVRNESYWYRMRKKLGPKKQNAMIVKLNTTTNFYEAYMYKMKLRESDAEIVPKKHWINRNVSKFATYKYCEEGCKQRDMNPANHKKLAVTIDPEKLLSTHFHITVVSELFQRMSNTQRVAVVYDELLKQLGESVIAPKIDIIVSKDTSTPTATDIILPSPAVTTTATSPIFSSVLPIPETTLEVTTIDNNTSAPILTTTTTDITQITPAETSATTFMSPTSAAASKALEWINAAFSTPTEIAPLLDPSIDPRTGLGLVPSTEILLDPDLNDGEDDYGTPTNLDITARNKSVKNGIKNNLDISKTCNDPNISSTNPSISALITCAPQRNKVGSYFGSNMSNLDIFKHLPTPGTSLTLIIETKTPTQWRPDLYEPTLVDLFGESHTEMTTLQAAAYTDKSGHKNRLKLLLKSFSEASKRTDYIVDEKANKYKFNKRNIPSDNDSTASSNNNNFGLKRDFSQKNADTNDNINNFKFSFKNSISSISNNNIVPSKATIKSKPTRTTGLRDRLGIDPLLLPSLGSSIVRGTLSYKHI